jgi:HlyD family secretion protein
MTVRNKWIAGAGAVLAAGLIAALAFRRSDALQFFTVKLERGEIKDAVDATGTVSAVITVQVGSQVSGTIARLNADFNSRVHQGDVLAVIDPSLLQGALLQATADLASAQANVAAAQANVEKATALKVQTKAAYDRLTVLERQGFDTKENVEVARSNADAASASVAAAHAAVEQARAQVDQKQAALSVAKTNVAYTIIRSPIDGVVLARNVDVGQTVAASLQAPTIFTIARDLTKMQVYAKIDESDVGRIKIGQRVTFKVDAYPEQEFDGAVSQVRMNATTVQNVVTYDAIIDFANPQLKLFPGMTAYVNIPVATVEDAIKLPNAALRYKPPYGADQIRALYAKYGMQDAAAADAPGADSAKSGKGGRAETGIVWKMRADNTLEPVRVTLGITDHAFTEVKSVVHGDLKVGDEVVTGSLAGKSAATAPVIRR